MAAAPRAAFRFTNASLAFSFTGTVGDRGLPTPLERLATPDALSEWLYLTGLSPRRLEVTAAEFHDALEVREAIHRLGSAIVGGDPVDEADVHTINVAANHRPPRPEMTPDAADFAWVSNSVREALSAIASDAILTAADAKRRRLIRLCENPKCRSLFLDESRPGTRRWCSMRTCGAAAKKRNQRSRTLAKSR